MSKYANVNSSLFNFFNLFPLIFGSIHLLFSIFPIGRIDPNTIFIVSILMNLLVFFKTDLQSKIVKVEIRFIISGLIYLIIIIPVVYYQFLNFGGDYPTHVKILNDFAFSFNDETFGFCCYYPSGSYGLSFFIQFSLNEYRSLILILIAILFLFVNLLIYASSFGLLRSKDYYIIFVVFPFFFFFFSQNGLIGNLTALSFSFWLANQTNLDRRIKIIFYLLGITIHPAVLFYYPNLLLISSAFKYSSISLKSLKSLFVSFLKVFIPLTFVYSLFTSLDIKRGSPLFILHIFFKDHIETNSNLLSILNIQNFLKIPYILGENFMYPFSPFSHLQFLPMIIVIFALFGLFLMKKPYMILHFCVLISTVVILNSGYGGPFSIIRIAHFPVYAQSHRAMPLIFTYSLIGICGLYNAIKFFIPKLNHGNIK